MIAGVCKWQGLGLTVLYFRKLTSERSDGGEGGEKSRAGSNGLIIFLKLTSQGKVSVEASERMNSTNTLKIKYCLNITVCQKMISVLIYLQAAEFHHQHRQKPEICFFFYT